MVLLPLTDTGLGRNLRSRFMTDGAATVGEYSLSLPSLSLDPHDPVGSPEPAPLS